MELLYLLRPRSTPSILILAVLLGLGPAARVFLPWPLTTPGASAWSMGAETAYLAALIGSAWGLCAILGAGHTLQPLGPFRRVRVEASLLATAIALSVMATLVAAVWLSWGPPPGDLAPGLVVAAFASVVHLIAMALLVRHASLRPSAAVIAFLTATWLLPNLLTLEPAQILLDPSIHLTHWRLGITKPGLAVDMMPVLALLVAVGLWTPVAAQP